MKNVIIACGIGIGGFLAGVASLSHYMSKKTREYMREKEAERSEFEELCKDHRKGYKIVHNEKGEEQIIWMDDPD